MMESLKARIRLYELLASAFSPPTEERKAEVLDGRLARRIQGILEDCCEIAAQCCLPPEFLEEVRGLSPPAVDEGARRRFSESLDAEYVRLFVNDFPTVAAPPYESFYAEGRVMGRAALACRDIYGEAGLALKEGGELPDHIVSQLEYLRVLCLAENKAAAEEDEALRRRLRGLAARFYEAHIMTWVPEFCTRIRKQSHVPYYSVMAGLLKKFTALENRNLNHENADTVRGGSTR